MSAFHENFTCSATAGVAETTPAAIHILILRATALFPWQRAGGKYNVLPASTVSRRRLLSHLETASQHH